MVFAGSYACVIALKTFAHGWATPLLAMDRLGDHSVVVVERTNDLVLAQELQRLLSVGLVADELAEAAELCALVQECRFTGFFERFTGVLAGQCEQPLNDSMPLDASRRHHCLCPRIGVRANRSGLPKQIADALLQPVDLGLVNVID